MVLRVLAKTTSGEALPERALVRTVVTVHVGLDPRITRSRERRVAGLERQGVEEDLQEDNVALRAGGLS